VRRRQIRQQRKALLSPAYRKSRFALRGARRQNQIAKKEKEVIIMKNLDRIRKQMTPARRRRIKARAAEIMAEEMTRQQLRRARKLTQVRMAKKLGMTQDGVSRLEKRTDVLLSTLRGYIEALGGKFSLVAEFPDRNPVILSGIAEDDPAPRLNSRKRTAAGAKSASR
jgi:DNA-binding XRE family transcriptional regulator